MSKKLVLTAFTIIFAYICSFGDFDACKFNFGTDFDYLEGKAGSNVDKNIDYVTKWIVDASYDGNAVYGRFLNHCKEQNKTPVFYSYIVAKAAGLGDQNVGGQLGTLGGQWLKTNINNVVNYYSSFAKKVAENYGTSKPVIWLMEPDYYQYCDGEGQNEPSFQEAGQYMEKLIDAVMANLPNALFALDISPWIDYTPGKTADYYGKMPLDKVQFLFTSGGESQGGSTNIKNPDPMTWSGVYNTVKKPIIADCGYGVGGASTGHNAAWDNANNLKSRIADGVCAVTQKNPDGNWGIANLRTQLEGLAVKSCGVIGNNYKLTVKASNGTVKKTPDSESYASDSKVTLVAEPSAGYVFKGWSGDASGSNASIEITMDKDKSVTAEFEKIPSDMFSVSVKVAGGSGSVKISNEEPYYKTGTKVTLTAVPVKGVSVFKSWSGAGLSGSDLTATLTVGSSDAVVTATFEDTLVIDSIKVEAESYKSKVGDAIKTETSNGVTSIGYIESGFSTTYDVDIPKTGSYSMTFRVASGIDNSSFDAQVGGKNVGSISFAGTNDNNRWDEWKDEEISKEIELEKGVQTVQVNFKSAINLDWFLLVCTDIPDNVIAKRNANPVKTLKVGSLKGGFVASLPSMHNFSTYSLFDITGKMVKRGAIKHGTSELKFSNLTKNIWILKVDGVNASATVRTAVIR